MEKIISVKTGKVETKDDNEWVELTDHEDKVHRVFKGVKLQSGEWRDLSDRVEALKIDIEAGTIEGKAFKLTKEQKGKFWNVIDIEEVKNILEKEAMAKVRDIQTDEKTRSIEKQVALKSACELAVGKIIEKEAILPYAELFTDWLEGTFKAEYPLWATTPMQPQTKPQPAKVEALKQPTAIDVEDLKAKIKKLYNMTPKKIDGTWFVKHGLTKLGDLDTLSQDKLLEIAKEVEAIK